MDPKFVRKSVSEVLIPGTEFQKYYLVPLTLLQAHILVVAAAWAS